MVPRGSGKIQIKSLKHILQRHRRMMISPVLRRTALLNRPLRTPVEACEALFARMLPLRPAPCDRDIADRTDLRADAAPVARGINAELLVRLPDVFRESRVNAVRK